MLGALSRQYRFHSQFCWRVAVFRVRAVHEACVALVCRGGGGDDTVHAYMRLVGGDVAGLDYMRSNVSGSTWRCRLRSKKT